MTDQPNPQPEAREKLIVRLKTRWPDTTNPDAIGAGFQYEQMADWILANYRSNDVIREAVDNNVSHDEGCDSGHYCMKDDLIEDLGLDKPTERTG